MECVNPGTETAAKRPARSAGRKLLGILFIVGLGAASVALVVAVNSWSAPLARKHEERRLHSSILDAASIVYPAESVDAIFSKRVRQQEAGGLVYFAVDSLILYQFDGRGLWGPVRGIVTLDSGLTHIASIRVLEQEETPGLGDRIKDPAYLATYRGKRADTPLELAIRHEAETDSEVDAIGGATLSSEALLVIVNNTTETLRRALRGGAK
jgi:Na+-transporting NADH:ubiquinone oxidoreductase subunit C